MNNLEMIQEAATGMSHMWDGSERETISLDFGHTNAVVYPPLGGFPSWEVGLANHRMVSFPTMADALDWLCEQVRLVA